MASRYSDRPKLERGALVVYTSYQQGAEPTVLNFQYNPAELRRTLEKRQSTEEGAGSNAQESPLRASGPPVEKLTLAAELDAVDQLAGTEEARDEVKEYGLHPALAILELLLYPPSARLQENREQAADGDVQVNPEDLPLVVLVWGQQRAVPVTITSFSVTEQQFDARLNPVRAQVELGMQVLTTDELDEDNIGHGIYTAYLESKEEMARKHPTSGTWAAPSRA